MNRAQVPLFTHQGCIALGELVRRDRTLRFGSLEKLQQRLAELGVEVSESTLQRLERPQLGKQPSWEVVNAIAWLGFVRNPLTGRSFTTTELMLIACEWIDPQTGKLIHQGDIMPADNEFLRLVREQYPTEAALLAASELSEEEVAVIFEGGNPDTVALGFLADVLYKDRTAGIKWTTDELAEMCDRVYGVLHNDNDELSPNNNPPTPEAQEEHHEHHVGNGCS
jgi:hypothetical protein